MATVQEMASSGGRARAAKLSKKRRLEIAMMGVLARKKGAKQKKLRAKGVAG